ncbi:acyl-CoA dehydrogenase family protein [Streptomyces sp. YIM 98790]|uniref:acyl-CoA dehydrogenase family protein n=1 Tax=Streptomyces sp. YIM 98790 TaxID=2689077 RepID=UPI00140D39BA|nr:acyl-CoA dehydrogenase family protein [Streptomyces sp. YIM 98790]
MRRKVFNEDHEAFRQMFREFVATEVVPVYDEWEAAGRVPREFYKKLGELGIFGIEVPEEYGGAGQNSYKYQAVLTEELSLAGVTFGGSSVHVGLCLPYLMAYCTEEQKQRWLPPFVTGDMMFAIAMTEPGTGSDLAGMQTTAKLSADGTHYVLNGAKTFITGGVQADRVLVCARTSPPDPADRRGGITILAVDTSSEGYSVGRKLDKMGLLASDTGELFFSDVKVPVEDRLGEEGRAFEYLTHNLPQERLGIAMYAYAQALASLSFARDYVKQRIVFGKPVAAFQNTKFVLADCQAEVMAMQALIDKALDAHDEKDLSAADAAAVKLFCTERSAVVIDKCLQLHGGYGYMREYPISRMYVDNRVTRIYGGTSEVMRSIVSKSMDL